MKLCRIFGKAQITEFNYRMADHRKAFVLVGIKTKTEESFKALKDKLKKSKFKFNDLTKNEISNDHLRHMVGGRNNQDADKNSERIFRSEFPQKPDALINFLRDFGTNWNISLFHYRNLGAAFAKVLIGIQDNPKSSKKLESHLKGLEYNFIEETTNNAYQDFLR